MTAISPEILSLQDQEIAKQVDNKYKHISKSGGWTYLEDEVGTKTKISKSGIVKTKRMFSDFKTKDELEKISKDLKVMSTSLFGVNPVYNVFILHEPEVCNKLFEKVRSDRKITSISFTLKEDIYVELKLDSYECRINMIGVSDTSDIIDIYNGIISSEEESLKKLSMEHLNVTESLF